MALTEESQHLQNPPLFLDALLCEEDFTETDEEEDCIEEEESFKTKKSSSSLPLILLENNDDDNDDDEFISLISKEKETHHYYYHYDSPCFTIILEESRQQAIFWVSKVCSHYNFSALTNVLAVNYFDRFLKSLEFQSDKPPWMTQLAAVASLSLAAKMEETQVPLLLDLQVEDSKYVFEAKTIQRMELLVLSTLQWRMNLVTPISFFQHIVRRLGVKSRDFFIWRCERLLLLVIMDSKVMSHLPSTIAAATIIHVVTELEPHNATQYKIQLLGLLKISEEQVNQCYELIVRILCCHKDIIQSKRKRLCDFEPNSVMDAYFSSDTSNDSWAVGSVSLSPDPTIKRSRTQEQQQTHLSINVVN